MLDDYLLIFILGLAGILLPGATRGAVQTRAQSIRIVTGWGGLGMPQRSSAVIRYDNGVYRQNGVAVDPVLVEALLRALRAPAIVRPNMSNLGVTAAWLRAHLAAVEGHMPGRMEDALPSQLRLFEDSFVDPQRIAGPVADEFRYTRFDDYPYASVEVLMADGTRIVAKTHSYYAFMIPWTVGQKTKTYNADLSRAVSALLPANTTDKERLAGAGFADGLADALSQRIQNQWNLLGVEGRAGKALAILRQHYKVLRADINPYHDVYFGRKWKANGPHETNLHVLLHKPDFPPNVNEDLVLEFAGGKVQGLEAFLKDGPRYERLALSVPWLNAWLRQNPDQTMTLTYVHDASLGEHATESFAADMEARGRADLIPPVSAQRKHIVLLHIGFVYWLLFPDHHMMLWRFEGPRGFLKWKESDFPAGNCDSYYAVNNGGCSGREVSPQGQLLASTPPRDRTCMAAWRRNHGIPHPLPEALFTIDEDGREGMIDAKGDVVIPPCFDGIDDFSGGLARFERDNLWGYVNAAGDVVIPPKYPWAEAFHDGLAWVQMKGHALEADARWGVIDTTGRTVIRPTYTQMTSDNGEMEAFHNGLAMVQSLGKSDMGLYGYVDRTGRMVIPPRFTLASPFSEGIAAATESGFRGVQQWGFIDRSGKWLIQPKFSWASEFVNGLAAVTLDGRCGYIDHAGKMVVVPPTPAGEKDCATVWGDFHDGLSRWRFGGKYGFIDRYGRTVIAPKFDLTFGFSEGLAAVKVGGEWGYVNTSGQMAIPLRHYQSAGAFHNGLARVTTKDGYGYINHTGEMVWWKE